MTPPNPESEREPEGEAGCKRESEGDAEGESAREAEREAVREAKGPGFMPAFRHRNFRLFFAGQAISLVGSWLQISAIVWLVWKLTHRNSAVGQMQFASQIPNLFLAPIAGALADRYSRHTMVFATQFAAAIQAALLAALTLGGFATFPRLFCLALLLGLINAFDMPSRQSFLVEMVDRPSLPNAIALNSFVFNAARIVGPPLAGWLLVALPIGVAHVLNKLLFAGAPIYGPLMGGFTTLRISAGLIFLANALSFFFVFAALGMMRLAPRPAVRKHEPVIRTLVEALTFVRAHVALRDVLLLIGVISSMGFPYQVLLASVSDRVFDAGSGGYGFFLSAGGIGAFLGAGALAAGALGRRIETVIPAASVGFGLCLVLFAASGRLGLFWLTVAITLPTGSMMMLASLSTNTHIQRLVPDRLRGRVMSFYTMMLLGLYPLGSLTLGKIADRFGPMITIGCGGAVCVIAGVIGFARLPAIRASAKVLATLEHLP